MGQYGPQISIAKDLAELVHETAKRVVEFAKKIIASKGRFSMVLSGGSTPRLLYHQLSTHRELDWSKVDFFFGDERMVPWDHPDSNYRLAHDYLFQPLGILSSQIHGMETHLAPIDAAKSYDHKLRHLIEMQHRSLDLVLLGLGADAHTASIFPGSSLLLENSENHFCQAVLHAPKPPACRLTMTPYAINQAEKVIVLVSGKEKAAAVCAALESDADPIEVPIRGICPKGTLVWMIDRAAACARRWRRR